MISVRKTTCSLLLPFLAAAAFALVSAAPVEALTAEDVQRCVDAGKALNLNDENLKLDNEDAAKDARFMGLLRAKLRIARLIGTSYDNEEGGYILRTQAGPLIAFLAQGGFPSPEKLIENAVERIVKPLELQTVVRELPRYYEAVVTTEGWQKKFQKMLSRDYLSLDGGAIFHLAGFPEIGDKPYYTAAMDIELKDGSLSLYEGDSSVEGWLYSFWLRRWQDGTMDAAKMAIDWLNKALGQ